MKKMLITIALTILTTAALFAQKDTTAAKSKNVKDTTVTLTDSTDFIEMKDLKSFAVSLQDIFTVTQYNAIMIRFDAMVNQAADRYFKRHKKQKP